jgi:hypothetical protein
LILVVLGVIVYLIWKNSTAEQILIEDNEVRTQIDEIFNKVRTQIEETITAKEHNTKILNELKILKKKRNTLLKIIQMEKNKK